MHVDDDGNGERGRGARATLDIRTSGSTWVRTTRRVDSQRPGDAERLGITVTFTNTDSSPVVRVALNADATGTTSWCAAVTTSPATIAYTAFTTQCYNSRRGAAYAKQPIISVQLSVPGGAATGAVNITLVSVVENP